MESFKEYVEIQEVAHLLVDCDIDPVVFAEWALQNEEAFMEGLAGNVAGWAGRQAGNAALWGAKQAGRAGLWGAKQAGNAALGTGKWAGRQALAGGAAAGRWGARQAGNAAVGAANLGMQGINRAGQGMQNAANKYDRWRDPVSRIDTAVKAIDQVAQAYGDHRVDGGLPVERIITKMKDTLLNLKNSIDREKGAAAPGVA